ncbi:MAG TPA: glycoside hydrolase, partial [Bacillales bacterium]|nr:glycoside hydrolase [Bacillales bacterium]
WAAWLQERHGEIEALQNHWNMTPDELPDFQSAPLPEQSEIAFDVEDIKKLKKNTRWLDYTLFTMEIHNRWAKELLGAIQNDAPQQLVTVGQDEALGRGPRPSPFFYAEAVDYTTVHSWWLNDDLVWDGVFGKAPNKPNLIQETGVMYLENPNNTGKRSESEIQYMLERKYAYAFSTGSAGAVQWLWNTNYFMDNVNESNIGAVRADGTQKPETLVSYEYGSFIKGISNLFENRELEDVAVVFPYSNDFSNRRLAFDATTKAVRVLTYDLKVPVRGIGEYHLDSLDEYPPKLIIVPSPHNFSDAALDKLIEFVENTGAVMLFTGPVGLDEYWFESDRIEKELGKTRLRNVVREEVLNFNGQSYPVSYGRRRIAEVSKEVVEDDLGEGSSALHTLKLGKGELVWCPLPVELNDRMDVVGALYKEMLAKADIGNNLVWLNGEDSPGIYGRKVVFEKGNLFVFVSESAMDQNIVVKDPKTERTYQFTLEKERAVLFSTDQNGNLEEVYRNASVTAQ